VGVENVQGEESETTGETLGETQTKMFAGEAVVGTGNAFIKKKKKWMHTKSDQKMILLGKQFPSWGGPMSRKKVVWKRKNSSRAKFAPRKEDAGGHGSGIEGV